MLRYRRWVWGLAAVLLGFLPGVEALGAVPQSVGAIQEERDARIGEIEKNLERIRAARAELARRLDEARRDGAERQAGVLEQKSAQLRDALHRGEQELVEARRHRPAGQEARPEPRRPQGDDEQRAWQGRIEHAQQAVRHLREAQLPDLAEMAARRTEELVQEWRQQQAARQQRAEAERQRERAAAAELDARRDPSGGDGTGRADRERQWEMLNELREQVEALRREVRELRRREQ